MSNIATRSGRGRTWAAAAIACAGTAATIGALAATAAPAVAATTQPPTVTSAFAPTLIGVGSTSAVAFTITDPNATGTLSSIGFTDILAGGGVIDNPNGVTTSGCGSSLVVTANPGTGTITVSAASAKAGTPCTIDIAVTAPTAGSVTSTTGTISYGTGATTPGSSATLTVLALPTVTVAGVHNGEKLTYGQKVTVTFSCSQPADTAGLEGCTAQDDLGNTIVSGGLLDTNAPGAHELDVQAFSVAGTTDATVDYTVLPDNQFTIKGVKATGSTVRFKLALPGAGTVKITEVAGSRKLATKSLSVQAKKTVSVRLAPSGAGAALLAKGSRKVTLRVVYTPKGGVARTLRKGGVALR